MVKLLRKIFIKDYENIKNQRVREAHGKLASFVGVFSNLVLFIIKILAGLFSKSVSIIADSINNLSDMGSSVVTLIGFKMANKPADEDHPYGHERIEYIAGLIVAIIIIFVGLTLAISSFDKIFNYEYVEIPNYISYISIGILCASILIKLWQSLFNKSVGRLIDSIALEATAADSRNDCISTTVILIGTIISLIFKDLGFSLDGILGILVSLFIVFSGAKLIKDTMDPLIGSSVPVEYVSEIVDFVKSHDDVLGVHDVICHMYGPTKCFMTLHAEVDAADDMIKIHTTIDQIEHDVYLKYGVELTIHMDPLDLSDEFTNIVNQEVGLILNDLDSNLDYHDFRMVKKHTVSTILFDIVIPFKYKMNSDEIVEHIKKELKLRMNTDFDVIVNFDHHFIKKEKNSK